ncbi:hypothetical protein BP5796_09958 [Coleophoma crateriformis]|uniref:Uncharacterized protein n=1 Tax=Coleophoma crateriformis TaxID=565419 RepID=A0A3D8QTV2_9HELO|nr:hypothetical protein BP5796_09958 [Coleophoma crateriformis]
MAQTPPSPSYALHSIAVAYGLAYLPNYYSVLRLAAAAPTKISFAIQEKEPKVLTASVTTPQAKTKPRHLKTPPPNPALEPMLPRTVRAPERSRRLPALRRIDVGGDAHAAAERGGESERRAVSGAAGAVYGVVYLYGKPDRGVGADGGVDFGRGGAACDAVEGGECGEGGDGLVRVGSGVWVALVWHSMDGR